MKYLMKSTIILVHFGYNTRVHTPEVHNTPLKLDLL
jgi:hypothetical protein